MARSSDPLRRDSVARQAQGTGARLASPDTNSALQLAGALARIEPTANAALQDYAKDKREAAEVAAKRDSLVANGAKLGDAVREGKLEPTSNPWYLTAYARTSAAVRGQSSLSALQLASASWPEKNDPAAFEKRWREEAGSIAGTFQSTDEAKGFLPVEAQFTQQALQSNVSQNVTRIVTERNQDLSALASSTLSQAIVRGGGKISANQAAEALKPARDQYLATGGTQGDWNILVAKAVTSAAYATKNSGVIDLLHAPELVSGVSDGGNDPLGDGADDHPAEPLPLVPIAPVPAAAVVPGKRWAVGELTPVAKALGGTITSGLRSAKHNAEVGGKPGSQHLAGTAIDVVFPKGTSVAQVKAQYAEQGAHVDVIDEGDHFHVQGARNPHLPTAASAVVQAADTPAIAAPPIAAEVTPPQLVRGPSIYDIAGIADAAESDRYRITQANETAATSRLRAHANEVKASGAQAADAAWAAHGTSLLTGEVGSTQLIREMEAAHYKPQAIAAALGSIREALSDNAGLNKARIEVNGSDPTTARQIMDLGTRAFKGGYTEGMENEVGELVLKGVISGDEGQRMVTGAIGRQRTLTEQQRSDTNYAQSQDDRAKKATSGAKAYATLKRNATSHAGRIATVLLQAGLPIDAKARAGIQRQVSDGMQGWLSIHPDDFAGADVEGRRIAADIGVKAAAALRAKKGGGQKPRSSPTPTSPNPRGGQR